MLAKSLEENSGLQAPSKYQQGGVHTNLQNSFQRKDHERLCQQNKKSRKVW